MSRGETNGTSADDGDFVFELLNVCWLNVEGPTRLWPKTLRKESLQSPDRNRLIDLPTPASGFARMRTDPPADTGKWIGFARKAICLLEPSFCDETNISPGIGMRRTGHHAWEIRVEPVLV